MNTPHKRKPAPVPVAHLTVRFPPEDLKAMRRLAKRNHRSLNAEVVHAVATYICQQGAVPDDEIDGIYGEQEI